MVDKFQSRKKNFFHFFLWKDLTISLNEKRQNIGLHFTE